MIVTPPLSKWPHNNLRKMFAYLFNFPVLRYPNASIWYIGNVFMYTCISFAYDSQKSCTSTSGRKQIHT